MGFSESFRDLKRISHVVNVLFKNGMGYFISEFNLKLHLSLPKKLALHRFAKPDKPEERLRKSMEALGGSFVKLGQLLSVRPDLVPFEYCKEFSRLQDRVEPFPFAEARKIIEAELGKPLSKVFSKFESKPMGSASIAQVHTAKLKTGENVVVKVQRPNIREIFRADIDIMKYFARKLEQSERIGRYSPSRIVEEFERYTKREMDFLTEASSIEKFYSNFKGSKAIRIPQAYTARSTPKVLVLEHLPGRKLSELLSENAHFNRKMVAKHLIEASLKMAFEHGFFHADLHPGNILVTKKGIGIIDFGIVGRMKPEYKKEGLSLYVSLINEDTEGVISALLRAGKASANTDLDSFREDVEEALSEWYGKQLRHVRFTHMLHKLFDTCFDHNIKIPPDMVLYAKSMITAEGTGMQLYPTFNFVTQSQPYMKKYLQKPLFPRNAVKRFMLKSREIGEMIERMPAETLHALEAIRQGKVRIDIEDTDIKHLGMEIDRSSNRLSYALVIAALVVGAAWTVQAGTPVYRGYSAISLIFFFTACFLGLILLTSIVKEGKTKY